MGDQAPSTSPFLPPWSRHYTIDVAVTNSAGLTATDSLVVPVIFNIRRNRRQLMGAVQAVTTTQQQQEEEEEPHRELHPGAASDGRRFKLLEVTGVLGQIY